MIVGRCCDGLGRATWHFSARVAATHAQSISAHVVSPPARSQAASPPNVHIYGTCGRRMVSDACGPELHYPIVS